MYLWMCQEACLPSLTDSTVVLAKPAMSPPANTQGSLVCVVSLFTSGVPHPFSCTGSRAFFTVPAHNIKEIGVVRVYKRLKQLFVQLCQDTLGFKKIQDI